MKFFLNEEDDLMSKKMLNSLTCFFLYLAFGVYVCDIEEETVVLLWTNGAYGNFNKIEATG